MWVSTFAFTQCRYMLTQTSAGGGAYYFAKQSINADRQARHEADLKRRRMQEALEYSSNHTTKSSSSTKPSNSELSNSDNTASPSHEANVDPAPTRHAPESAGQRVREKSKYEASEPFRSKKGDRFS